MRCRSLANGTAEYQLPHARCVSAAGLDASTAGAAASEARARSAVAISATAAQDQAESGREVADADQAGDGAALARTAGATLSVDVVQGEHGHDGAGRQQFDVLAVDVGKAQCHSDPPYTGPRGAGNICTSSTTLPIRLMFTMARKRRPG